jgi:hypothetical protein
MLMMMMAVAAAPVRGRGSHPSHPALPLHLLAVQRVQVQLAPSLGLDLFLGSAQVQGRVVGLCDGCCSDGSGDAWPKRQGWRQLREEALRAGGAPQWASLQERARLSHHSGGQRVAAIERRHSQVRGGGGQLGGLQVHGGGGESDGEEGGWGGRWAGALTFWRSR